MKERNQIILSVTPKSKSDQLESLLLQIFFWIRVEIQLLLLGFNYSIKRVIYIQILMITLDGDLTLADVTFSLSLPQIIRKLGFSFLLDIHRFAIYATKGETISYIYIYINTSKPFSPKHPNLELSLYFIKLRYSIDLLLL